MIPSDDLYYLAKSRFEEAEILLTNGKPEGAVYLCGYALELILKRHIVKILNWDGYPNSRQEFEGKLSFKTHKLDVLSSLAGLEKEIQTDNKMLVNWQLASAWDSEIRYNKVGELPVSEAKNTINATRDMLNFVYNHE